MRRDASRVTNEQQKQALNAEYGEELQAILVIAEESKGAGQKCGGQEGDVEASVLQDPAIRLSLPGVRTLRTKCCFPRRLSISHKR